MRSEPSTATKGGHLFRRLSVHAANHAHAMLWPTRVACSTFAALMTARTARPKKSTE